MAFNIDNFIIEVALLHRRLSALVGTHAKLVLLFSGNAVHFAQQFSGQAHHHRRFGRVFAGCRVDVNAVSHGYVLHMLHATDDKEITHARFDIGRRDMQRRHRRTAQTVDRLRRYRTGNTGHNRRVASNIH